MANTNLMIIKT